MITLIALIMEETKCRMLIDELLSKDNLLLAHKKVVSNKGASGIDGISVEELWEFCQKNWNAIKTQITNGTYVPNPVKKVEIPKAGGGKRKLGIPCVIDRLILQALNQILTPIFEVGFAENSYGFRPSRSAHDAVKKSGEHIAAGYIWVVNVDLERFFDRVNHDILMSKIARKIKDKLILKLIRAYLRTGVMDNGVVITQNEGTIQGAPLSPLLSNIMLDDLDKELESRGHRYCHFADDCNIYVKSERAGNRVMESIEKFLWKKLKLVINQEKSEVVKSNQHNFLGYKFYGFNKPKLGIAQKSIKRLKDKIRRSYRRWRGMKMQDIVKELNKMTQGWIVYFRLANCKKHLAKLETWIQRHLRKIHWRQWKTERTRFKKLLSFDVNQKKAAKAAWGKGGPWYSSATSALNFALNGAYFRGLGWFGLTYMYDKYKINVKFI